MTNKVMMPFIGLLIFFVTSCNNNQREANIEALIKAKHLDSFKLVRSVRNAKRNFELQLRTASEYTNNEQQIVVFTNKSQQYYILPFPSNAYRGYWEFESNSPKNKGKGVTFIKEFTTALNTLGLNDTLGTADCVLQEMLISLLHCVPVTESDSNKLLAIRLVDNNNLPEETSEDAEKRVRQNYKMIRKAWYPKKFFLRCGTYYDSDNNRVYQFENKNDKFKAKCDFEIKVYRQDQVYHRFTM
jgi:hypothetical protein